MTDSANLEKNGVLNPLEMPEVIEKILHFSSLDDLKNVRLTCKLWNRESTWVALKKFWICPPSTFCSQKFTIPPETFDDILITELNDAFHTNFPRAGFLNPDNPDHTLFRETFESEFRALFHHQLNLKEKGRQEEAGKVLRRLLSQPKKSVEPQINFESSPASYYYPFNLCMEDFTEINFFADVPLLPFENVKMVAIGYCKCFIDYQLVQNSVKNLKKILSQLKNLEILQAPLSSLIPDWRDGVHGNQEDGEVIENFLRQKYDGLTKLREIRAAPECHTISSSTLEGFINFQKKFVKIVENKGKHLSKIGASPKIEWKMTRLRLELQSTESLENCRQAFHQLRDHLRHLKISFGDYDDDDDYMENFNDDEIQNQRHLADAKTANVWLDNWYIPLSLSWLKILSIDSSHHHVNSRKFHAIALQLPCLKKFEISSLAIVPLAKNGHGEDDEWRKSKSLETLRLHMPRGRATGFQNLDPNHHYPFLKVYPNLKNLEINLTNQGQNCLNFTRTVLHSIFVDAGETLEELDLTLENSKGHNKVDQSWDQLLAGADCGPSIKNLGELKRLTIRVHNENGLTDHFIYEGLMALKNVQSVQIEQGNRSTHLVSMKAINDLRTAFGPHVSISLSTVDTGSWDCRPDF